MNIQATCPVHINSQTNIRLFTCHLDLDFKSEQKAASIVYIG